MDSWWRLSVTHAAFAAQQPVAFLTHPYILPAVLIAAWRGWQPPCLPVAQPYDLIAVLIAPWLGVQLPTPRPLMQAMQFVMHRYPFRCCQLVDECCSWGPSREAPPPTSSPISLGSARFRGIGPWTIGRLLYACGVSFRCCSFTTCSLTLPIV